MEPVNEPNAEAEDLLTLSEVGRLLGLSDETVRIRCHEGHIPFFRCGPRSIRIRRGDAEEYRRRSFHPVRLPPRHHVVQVMRM